ncbi:sigma-70 family RNA polymerase sigma factor [Fulvimarina sp. MAC3]|uniref:sigma-70 family RNA polymerase sigma factor n=1 Tax=Fulvimarina sp. MAC3 TaxID=3148887 RepID=UPI0031FCD387
MDQGLMMERDDDRDGLATFERVRSSLLAVAYRMLGTRADAEDVVQDVFLRWAAIDRAAVRNPHAWMMTACTRRSIDILRSAARSRTDYVGPWLPEPVGSEWLGEPDELSSSLETAFLLVLERASPKERAAFLLHEVFGVPHVEVASILDVTIGASRQLASRAARNVASGHQRQIVDRERQRTLIDAFQQAILTDDIASLSTVLAEDIRLVADGGGKATALPEPLQGRARVLQYLGQARGWWQGYRWVRENVATGPAVALLDGGSIVARIWLEVAGEARVSSLYIMRNPEKLGVFSTAGGEGGTSGVALQEGPGTIKIASGRLLPCRLTARLGREPITYLAQPETELSILFHRHVYGYQRSFVLTAELFGGLNIDSVKPRA